MAINTNFTNLTFDTIKQDLINQFKNTDDFKDYDFAGSRLNVLIDVLAYAITFNGAYSNTALFESYMQYARQRESVVALAQGLGYIPSSKTAASITIKQNFNFTGNTPPSELKVPRGFKYTSKLNSNNYDFVVAEDKILLPSSTVIYSGDIVLVQGKFIRSQSKWKVDSRIFLKDSNIDRRYIIVTINGTEYKLAENAARSITEDKVFYIRETIEGWTEIYFGMQETQTIPNEPNLTVYVGGLRPSVNDEIVIEYLVTKGTEANNISISNFKAVDSITDFKSGVIEIANIENAPTYSFGGGDIEDIERIRTVSLKKQEAQGRCVTVDDYKSFILDEFGQTIDNLHVWTEEGKSGYAYYAIKPVGGLTTTKNFTDQINLYLKKYNVATITPKPVDPIYIFIKSTFNIDFDPNLLKTSEVVLKQNIIADIQTYFKNNINDFGKAYYNSRVLNVVDNADTSILGSDCNVIMVKEIPITIFWNMNKAINTAFDPYYPNELPRSLSTLDNYPLIYDNTKLTIQSTDDGKLVIGPQTPEQLIVIPIVKSNVYANGLPGQTINAIQFPKDMTSLLPIGSKFIVYGNLDPNAIDEDGDPEPHGTMDILECTVIDYLRDSKTKEIKDGSIIQIDSPIHFVWQANDYPIECDFGDSIADTAFPDASQLTITNKNLHYYVNVTPYYFDTTNYTYQYNVNVGAGISKNLVMPNQNFNNGPTLLVENSPTNIVPITWEIPEVPMDLTPNNTQQWLIQKGDVWYEVGTIDYITGQFRINKIADMITNVVDPSNIKSNETNLWASTDFARMIIDIPETDIYPTNGELIVFEPYLRSEYITINLNPIITSK